MKITITPESIRDFVWEGDEEYDLIEEGDYTQDGKYQFATNVYEHLPTGKYYALDTSRSGSYHSDWYYDYENYESLTLYEVERVEITKYEWKAI